MLLCCAPLRCRRVSCLPHNLFRGNIAPTPPGHQGRGRGWRPPYGHSTRQDTLTLASTRVVSVACPCLQPIIINYHLLGTALSLLPSPTWSAQCPCPHVPSQTSDIFLQWKYVVRYSLQPAPAPPPAPAPAPASTSPPTLLTATIYEELGTAAAAAAAACAGSSSFVRQRGGELPPFTRASVYSWLIFPLACSALLATGAVG